MRGGGSGYYPKEGEHASAVDLTLGTQVFVHAAADICMQPRKAVRNNQPLGTVTI